MSIKISSVLKKTRAGRVYYFGGVNSDKIKGITFVPVREESKQSYLVEDTKNGYQRKGSISRMRKFKAYLKANDNKIVPPVLLSSRDGWEFKPSKENPNIGELIISKAAAIIDGQHRVGGYVALFEDDDEIREVDFLVIDKLSLSEEIEEFMVVNNTQKGVPKSLTTLLEGEDSTIIALQVNERSDSPFYLRISEQEPLDPTHLFTLSSFSNQVKRTFAHGKLDEIDLEDKIEIFIKYWEIISDEFEDQWNDILKLGNAGYPRGRRDFEWKMLELTGLIAWSYIAPEILSQAYISEHGIMNWDKVSELVQSLSEIDWKKDGQFENATGEVGGKKIFREMQRLLPTS
jgi:DNA sulfur modification protein DndB